ncbi:MAG: Holliday junction resolvase RuvX, partial [Pyrinomonadaceae bacterium]
IIRYQSRNVQETETTDKTVSEDFSLIPSIGRIAALDLGTKRIGVAVCDEHRNIASPLPRLDRTSWKKLLIDVSAILAEYDAKALVIGLPLESDGAESEMSKIAGDSARKFALSLGIPVYLQDERATSHAARANLWERGISTSETSSLVDSEAAAIILTDFIDKISKNANDSE